MKAYIIQFKETGISTVKTAKVIKDWRDHWLIAQWQSQYRLCFPRGKEGGTRCEISKDQAIEIIQGADLLGVKTFMKSATTWRNQRSIDACIRKVEKRLKDLKADIEGTTGILNFLNNATNFKQ